MSASSNLILGQPKEHGVSQIGMAKGEVVSSAVRRIIWWVFTGSRGGPNRARMVVTLKEQPMNANQIAAQLQMDYKTVRHHLGVLVKNHMLTAVGEGYGTMYFVSPELEQDYEEFIKIWGKIGSK